MRDGDSNGDAGFWAVIAGLGFIMLVCVVMVFFSFEGHTGRPQRHVLPDIVIDLPPPPPVVIFPELKPEEKIDPPAPEPEPSIDVPAPAPETTDGQDGQETPTEETGGGQVVPDATEPSAPNVYVRHARHHDHHARRRVARRHAGARHGCDPDPGCPFLMDAARLSGNIH